MKIIILILISQEYPDVTAICQELLDKYWAHCPYPIFFCGEKDAKIHCKNFIGFEHNITLPARIRKITERENPDYVICMLGDAFITNKINNEDVSKLIDCIQKEKIDYCNLMLRRTRDKGLFYKMPETEVYPFSFVFYVASRQFIVSHYTDDITDVQLEEKFLSGKLRKPKSYSMARIQQDIFHIKHGIVKGKWIRETKKILDRISKASLASNRATLNMIETLYMNITDLLIKNVTNKQYRFLQQYLGHKKTKNNE